MFSRWVLWQRYSKVIGVGSLEASHETEREALDASLDNPHTQPGLEADAVNARDFALQTGQMNMTSRPSIRIARKAHSKAESDFATWLMMAKLGSFDDLPANAQGVLLGYRARLERMSEAESKIVAVREVYASYYSEMGGLGTAPELEAPARSVGNGGARSVPPHRPPPARLAPAAPDRPAPRKAMPAVLIFVAMVALIAAYRFLMN